MKIGRMALQAGVQNEESTGAGWRERTDDDVVEVEVVVDVDVVVAELTLVLELELELVLEVVLVLVEVVVEELDVVVELLLVLEVVVVEVDVLCGCFDYPQKQHSQRIPATGGGRTQAASTTRRSSLKRLQKKTCLAGTPRVRLLEIDAQNAQPRRATVNPYR